MWLIFTHFLIFILLKLKDDNYFSGCGGSRRAPWEGRVWRAAPLPATPVCAEQLAEGRLLLSTTSNTYILEGNSI